ncbi:MAG TPA: WG repeat-containing protein [Blastocatellia bacterium]|nr:WG repeat-containing protein [Blastocatellia bacterium]
MVIKRVLWSLVGTVLLICQLGLRQTGSPSALYAVRGGRDGKWGYIDKTGRIVIGLQFDGARDFSDGLALVRKGQDSFFIDSSGRPRQELVQPSYEIRGGFRDGLALVRIGGPFESEYGYIDRSGRLVIGIRVDAARLVTAVYPIKGLPEIRPNEAGADPLLHLCVNGRCGYYDRSGREVIAPQFDSALNFSEGLAAVKIDGKYGYIDRTGRLAIPYRFDYAEDFSEGRAVAAADDKFGYIDRTGRDAIVFQYDWAQTFTDGLAAVGIGGKVGYLDPTGKVVIPLRFEGGGKFSEGLAPVRVGGRWGYLDRTGKMVIGPKFDGAGSFSDGVAAIELRGRPGHPGYIDKTGKYLWEPGR